MTEAAPAVAPALETQIHANLQSAISRGAMTLDQANATLAGSPYKPLAAPAVTPAAAARAGIGIPSAAVAPSPAAPTLTQLRADKGFMLRWVNQEPSAIAEHKRACQAAVGESVSPAGALEELDAFKADPANREAIANNDVAALAKLKELTQKAHPDTPSTDPAAVAAAAGLPADDAARDVLALTYQMPKIADAKGEYSVEAQAFDKLSRSALATAGFTRDAGSYVAAEISRTHDQWQKLDDHGKSMYAQQQDAMLKALWKADYEPNLKLARQLAHEIDRKHPGVMGTLIDSGAAYNATIISQLYHRALAIATAKRVDLAMFR